MEDFIYYIFIYSFILFDKLHHIKRGNFNFKLEISETLLKISNADAHKTVNSFNNKHLPYNKPKIKVKTDNRNYVFYVKEDLILY